jgi:predicted  nucleic acid-binding Zn-ribbon protein
VNALVEPSKPSERVVSWRSRLAGAAVLGAFVSSGGWLARQGFHAWRDGWVAPLHLSPDQEQVVQLKQNLSHEEFELARGRAEVERMKAEAGAVEAAIARLGGLRQRSGESVAWQAVAQTNEVHALEARVDSLARQRGILLRLRSRAALFSDASERDLASGFVDGLEASRAGMALDEVESAIVENELATTEAKSRLRTAATSAAALDAGLEASSDAKRRHPEVSAAHEREVRLELEVSRLEAEKRGLEATMRAAEEGVAHASKLVDEIKGRPLYRILEAPTDVVFVPYSQLEAVAPGAEVLACRLAVFGCRTVGRVQSLVPGEAITKDPWGNTARGQYALVQLDDAAAIREKVLRVRLD